jgi:hypothetical protein
MPEKAARLPHAIERIAAGEALGQIVVGYVASILECDQGLGDQGKPRRELRTDRGTQMDGQCPETAC